MKPLTPEQITQKLQLAPSTRGAAVGQLTDPVVETPMQVTLEQLRPYEHNPRFLRNSLYDEIKASIRERGLDQPPPITRRPGAPHFVIRNGGNTRLAILNELWQETRDERFYRIHCLFRPWDGELSALLGHLAENDLHGQLTFIERAIAVAKARDMLEDGGEQLSQRELSRKLAEGGYGVSQSNISRMFDTLEHLLPAIPQMLYQGLGRKQIERLIALRKETLRIWLAGLQSADSFSGLWLEVLAKRDSATGELDIEAIERDIQTKLPVMPASSKLTESSTPSDGAHGVCSGKPDHGSSAAETTEHPDPGQSPADLAIRVKALTSNGATDRVEQIRTLVDQVLDQGSHSVGPGPSLLSPEGAWYIEDADRHPDRLRQLIFEQAESLVQLSGSDRAIQRTNTGLGFFIGAAAPNEPSAGRFISLLLAALLQPFEPQPWQAPDVLFSQFLLGTYDTSVPDQKVLKSDLQLLPDDMLLSLLRLIRLARTLVDLIKETTS